MKQKLEEPPEKVRARRERRHKCGLSEHAGVFGQITRRKADGGGGSYNIITGIQRIFRCCCMF